MTGEKLGGGALRTARTFDAKTGRIGAIRSTAGMVSERQDLGYTWDVLGNLTTRTDTTGTRNLAEAFTYDTLNCLTSSRVGTGTTQTVSYDALKLWDSRHDLRPGDHIEIRRDSDSDLYWRGRVTHVANQNVCVGETKLQSRA